MIYRHNGNIIRFVIFSEQISSACRWCLSRYLVAKLRLHSKRQEKKTVNEVFYASIHHLHSVKNNTHTYIRFRPLKISNECRKKVQFSYLYWCNLRRKTPEWIGTIEMYESSGRYLLAAEWERKIAQSIPWMKSILRFVRSNVILVWVAGSL